MYGAKRCLSSSMKQRALDHPSRKKKEGKDPIKANRPHLKQVNVRISEDRIEVDEGDQMADIKEGLTPADSNFQSELDYEGYQSLEESDNDSYNSIDLERNSEPKGDLTIRDRDDEADSGEEGLIDPQENRK